MSPDYDKEAADLLAKFALVERLTAPTLTSANATHITISRPKGCLIVLGRSGTPTQRQAVTARPAFNSSLGGF